MCGFRAGQQHPAYLDRRRTKRHDVAMRTTLRRDSDGARWVANAVRRKRRPIGQVINGGLRRELRPANAAALPPYRRRLWRLDHRLLDHRCGTVRRLHRRSWRWRRAGQALLWAAAVGWAGFVVLRLLGLELAWLVVAALAYTPYVAVTSLLPLAGAVALRSWSIVAVVAVCAVALATMVVPRALPDAQPSANGPPLRVMAVNMYGGVGEPAAVMALVRRYQVEVLAVLELTGPVADALADQGIDALLPHQELRVGWSVEGSGVYSRFPLEAAPELESGSQFEMPAVRLQPPGADPVELMAVHPVPPVSGQIPTWRRELGALPPAVPGVVRVLAGRLQRHLGPRTATRADLDWLYRRRRRGRSRADRDLAQPAGPDLGAGPTGADRPGAGRLSGSRR